MKIVEGKKIASRILEALKKEAEEISPKPRLTVFLLDGSEASTSYVEAKKRKALEIGIEVSIKSPDYGSEDNLIREIKKSAEKTDGIIIQLPLPASLNKDRILNAIPPEKDVDCLTESNRMKLMRGETGGFFPPAAAAVIEILDYYKVALKGKNVLLIGSGELIGKPLAAILLARGVSFEIANRQTSNLSELSQKADIIISGVGKAGLITSGMVRRGVVVIDAGTAGTDTGSIAGDVDFEAVKEKAALITPVPGGVGPVTVAMLLRNVVKSARLRMGD